MDALENIQEKLRAPKNQFNKFGGYSYRSCEDILEAVKPLLVANGATLTLTDDIVECGGRIYIKATATLKSGSECETVTAYAREAESKKGMDESQITGTASSYARKYALNGLFLIDDNKDADTEAYSGNSQQKHPREVENVKQAFNGEVVQTKPQQKGGETTPEQSKELNSLLRSKYTDGSSVFTQAEGKQYAAMRTEKTADEVIALIKKELTARLNPIV